MKKLRLLLFEECNRSCPGCCNKDWDLKSLPRVKEADLPSFDEIMLTGGEPMLHPTILLSTVGWIRTISNAKVYLYTAKVDELYLALSILSILDGICVTLHDQGDVAPFELFAKAVNRSERCKHKSLRINIFQGVRFPKWWFLRFWRWKIKRKIQWIENCPLPKDEVFMRL